MWGNNDQSKTGLDQQRLAILSQEYGDKEPTKLPSTHGLPQPKLLEETATGLRHMLLRIQINVANPSEIAGK